MTTHDQYQWLVINHLYSCKSQTVFLNAIWIKCPVPDQPLWSHPTKNEALNQCWVMDGLVLNQHWVNTMCLLGDNQNGFQANATHISNGEWMLGQRRRRWPNNDSPLDPYFVFYCGFNFGLKTWDTAKRQTVCDSAPTLKQHRVNVSCFLGIAAHLSRRDKYR